MNHKTPFHPDCSVDQALENRILLGLAMEWESARDILSHNERRRFKMPVFSLKEGARTLAHWDPGKRIIAFSRFFVKHHSWDAVREVLRHEMAHQYAHEILLCGRETAHGPGFLKACDILRANPRASGTYPPLKDRLCNDDPSQEDKIMVKIQKLLALGQSSNPHEAQAALSKARQLIDTFNVHVIDSQQDPLFISLFVGRPTLRRFKEEYLITRFLVDHYHVYGIWVSAYVLDKGKMGRVFEITGRSENVRTAAYVYDFIMNRMNMAWNTVNAANTLGRYRKSDFACGLIQGFSDKLNEEKKKEARLSATKDVLCLEQKDPALIAYAAYKYPRTRRFSRSAGSVDEGMEKQGREIGRKLTLSKGVEQNDRKAVKALVFEKN